jgi:transposase
MIHKIKAMYDEGRGSSLRAIAEELRIARNTVRKYLAMSAEEITAYQERKGRSKRLDVHRAYIIHLLETYPRLSAVKILRKLQAAHGELSVSSRTMRRYIESLRETITRKQERYYEPVLDMAPGVQCQVDGGELRGVMIDGVETTVYLMVFVLSYSRLMYVAASARPIDTAELMRMHDAAFRYFGGRAQECVYDQTKLVVIEEEFRELSLNERFARYATTVGFRIRACEGYDPESKGKVEAGVKYVKNDGLYGETFASWADLQAHLQQWLEETANVRVHATTGQVPREHYEHEEKPAMAAYLSPPGMAELAADQPQTRKADKTGLIAFKANKYSVPLAYQRSRVGVLEEHGRLVICDLHTGEVVARHALVCGKGEIVKNTHHYRDREKRIAELEEELCQRLGEPLGRRLCALIKASEPRIYKDQLQGAKQVLGAHEDLDPTMITYLCEKPYLSARMLREYLEAYGAHPERLCTAFGPGVGADSRAGPCKPPGADTSLARYAGIGADNREVANDLH